MNDDKLEKILQQTLISDVTDEDILIYKKARRKKMKKTAKAGMAVAACAALILTANFSGVLRNVTDTEMLDSVENEFTMTCYAAELEAGELVPASLAGETRHGYGLSGGEDGQTVAYCIGNQFKCVGENILSITYSINNGAFCIMEKKGEGIVTSYEQYTGPELNVSGMGFADSELQPGETEDDAKYESIEASSYTVSYDAQESETTMFSICGEKTDANIYNAEFGDGGTIEEEIAANSSLMEGIEITCTVTYTDGTTDSKVIIIKGCEEETAYENEDGSEEKSSFAGFAYTLK